MKGGPALQVRAVGSCCQSSPAYSVAREPSLCPRKDVLHLTLAGMLSSAISAALVLLVLARGGSPRDL